MSNSLNINNVINVTLSSVPSGLNAYAVNNVAIFTEEKPNFIESYMVARSPREVELAFGSSSLSARLAENIFAQDYSILSGKGQLIVIPLKNFSSATFGKFTTSNILANVANFVIVTDGEFKLTLNGVNLEITNLDFSNCTTLDHIAEVINKEVDDITVIVKNSNSLEFTSKLPGATSSIALSAIAGGEGTSIIGSTFLNASGGTAVSGTDSTGGTFGKFLTASLTTNLVDKFTVVADGEFKLTLNGTEHEITGIDLTGVTTITALKNKLKTALSTLPITVSIVDASKILFKSTLRGDSSIVLFETLSGGTGTDLTAATLLNIAGGTKTDGSTSASETLLDAMIRTEDEVYYTGILTTAVLEDAAVIEMAAAIQSRDKIYYVPSATTECLEGLAETIRLATQTKTRVMLYTTSYEDAQLRAAANASINHSVNFAGSNTTKTMNLKALKNIVPDTIICRKQTLYDKSKQHGVDIYVSYEGVPCIASFGANEFLDNVINDIWVKKDLQVKGFNYLRQTNTKVPQTEQGMTGLKAALKQTLAQGVRNGAIAPGLNWNSSEKFGDEEAFLEQINSKGYYIYSLPIQLQAQEDRNDRIAPLIQIALKRAGAIHLVFVNVTVEN